MADDKRMTIAHTSYIRTDEHGRTSAKVKAAYDDGVPFCRGEF